MEDCRNCTHYCWNDDYCRIGSNKTDCDDYESNDCFSEEDD